ncbi:MAG: hypothetical protein HYV46_21140, partial [candidate division NC10 bacterium]|nr:hypothetical protein [candidate division NC10 bacterium]
GNDWAAIYPDHDKPAFHILVEAATRARAEEIAGTYRDKVKEWLARGAAA